MVTIDKMQEVKSAVLGTCTTLTAIIDNMDLDIDENDLEELLEIDSVQCCPECGWWVESYELEEDGEEVSCESCRFN